MQFLYPTFLWALLAISIPVLIHLFHFRRFKNVYFPNVRFLRELKEETSNRNKLKNLLVLLARILAITALVLAFAQPFIPQSDEMMKGRRAVSIYIDNSFSMRAQGEDINLINKAKLDALAVVNAYDANDRFQVISDDFDYAQQKWLSKEEAIELIESIETTQEVRLLSQVINRQHMAFAQSQTDNKITYWISDFQTSTSDLDPALLDSTVQYNAVYLSSIKGANIAIDSCWWVAPLPVKGQKGSLIVQLHNYDSQDIEDLTVNLNYNQQNFPLAKVSVPAQQRIMDTLSFTLNKAGWSEAKISIKDYPVQFDDEYFISFDVSENIPILVISESGNNVYIEAVFESSPVFELSYFPLSNIEYTALSGYKLIILDDISTISSGLVSALSTYLNEGGNLMVFPAVDLDMSSYNDLLGTLNANLISSKEEIEMSVGKINEQEFVFRDVFDQIEKNISLPNATMRYINSGSSRQRNRPVLQFRDGRSYIDAYAIGEGNLYFSSVPLDVEVNDLVKNAEIFVPMIYRMALSSNITGKIAYTIGKDKLIKVNRQFSESETPYKIVGSKEFIPAMRNIGPVVQLDIKDQIHEAGIYSLIHEDKPVRKLAFNYDRRESDLKCMTKDELESLVEPFGTLYNTSGSKIDLTENIVAREKGILLWKWFIILALMFFAIEIVLLRAIKT